MEETSHTEPSAHTHTKEQATLLNFNKCETLNLPQSLTVYRGEWGRTKPKHHEKKSLFSDYIKVNAILCAPGTGVYIPGGNKDITYLSAFERIENSNPDLFHRLIKPGGTAKSAADVGNVSPIKQLVDASSLPNDETNQGWADRERAVGAGGDVILAAQLNGLFFNRGSVIVTADGDVIAYPDMPLAKLLAEGDLELQQEYGVTPQTLKRPLLFLATKKDGTMIPLQFTFEENESYEQGIERLKTIVREKEIISAVSASPPFVVPDESENPQYFTRDEALSDWWANDVRHYCYLPYVGGVSLLFPELSRMQGIDGAALARSFSGEIEDRVTIPLAETRQLFDAESLKDALDSNGYHNRFAIDETNNTLSINLLPGVYSHLVPAVTEQGNFVLLQTSGVHGKITGNDGPTFDQMVQIIRDLNEQDPFRLNRIIAAFSGSQGNDVPDIWVKSVRGLVGRMDEVESSTALPGKPEKRGTPTTPRLTIVTMKNNEQ